MVSPTVRRSLALLSFAGHWCQSASELRDRIQYGSCREVLRAGDESFSNKELKAKAAFMAAKTEQNRYGTGDQPRTYFKLIKDSYSDTQYYREIISECATFRAY